MKAEKAQREDYVEAFLILAKTSKALITADGKLNPHNKLVLMRYPSIYCISRRNTKHRIYDKQSSYLELCGVLSSLCKLSRRQTN